MTAFRLLLLLACLSAPLAVGCGGPAPRAAGGDLSPGAVATHLGRLAAPADSAAAARRTLYAADLLRRAGLQPALPPSFLLAHPTAAPAPGGGPDPAASHVLGYVAGRNPTYAGELVLVVAPLEGPAGAAVLEAARLMAADARDAIRPEATVGVLLLGPPRAGLPGIDDYLRHPTWAPERITRVLVVAGDAATGEAEVGRWTEGGLQAEAASASSEGEARLLAIRLAEVVHARAHRLAARSFATAPPPETADP